MNQNKFLHGTHINREGADPLDHFRRVWVEGHGVRTSWCTPDLLTFEEIEKKWAELEHKLRLREQHED